MRIVRHCTERLPGGTRLWQKLACLADFNGTLLVYGYGTHGRPGREQLRAALMDQVGGFDLGDYTRGENLIRIWVSSRCALAFPKKITEHETPLAAFVHELGHHRQHVAGKQVPRTKKQNASYEAVAERYGRMLLRSVT